MTCLCHVTTRSSIAALLCWLLALHARGVDWVARHDLTWAQYQAEFNTFTSPPYNFRPISVCGYPKNTEARFAGIWAAQSGPGWISHHQMTTAEFRTLRATYAAQNFHPVFLSGFSLGNTAYYSAIWEYWPGANIVSEVTLFESQYIATNSNLIAQGYKTVFNWTFNLGSVDYFAGIWRKGLAADYQMRWHRSGAQYQQDVNTLSSQGCQLVVVSAAVLSGQPNYAAIWKKPGDGNWQLASHDVSELNYHALVSNRSYEGYRPVLASAFVTSSGPRFNAIFSNNGGMSPANLAILGTNILNYMQTNWTAGLSLAISRWGRLVYAKGFGLADIAADEWVHPDHRFRIGSVSKTITAAAVMKLADHCRLDVNSTVFGPGGILGNSYGNPGNYHPWELQITVRHLLQHTSGWNVSTVDPAYTTGNPSDAIGPQLDDTDPVSAPGTLYYYLNAGYVILGRVIERLSGRSYESFVKEEILAPSCITSMDIGGNSRLPNEVAYYAGDAQGANPYDTNPRGGDAAGGWIARAIDLLLFLRRIDGDSTNQADLLQSASATAMQTPSMVPDPNNNGNPSTYGFGLGAAPWFGQGGWGHNGGLPGTMSWLVYRSDGMAFAAIYNTDRTNDPGWIIAGAINTLTAANAWPSYDLFPCNIPPGSPPNTLAVPRNFYVDGNSPCAFPTGRQTCDLTFGGPFHAVVHGINALCAGDNLFIRTGSYNETPLFNRPMMVRSYDGPATIGQ